MDAYSLLRTLGALATVLGLLAGALWVVRRYGLTIPTRTGGGVRRLEVLDRSMVDGRRSVALIRRDGREHLVLLAPEGNLVIETGIIRDELDYAAEAVRIEAQREAAEATRAQNEAMRESFVAMVDKARSGAQPMLEQLRECVSPALVQVKERVSPALVQVKERVSPALVQVRARALGGVRG